MNYNKQSLLQLPVEEKIILVSELWDSISEEQKTNLLSESQKQFIKERIATDKDNPEGAIPWSLLRKKYPELIKSKLI